MGTQSEMSARSAAGANGWLSITFSGPLLFLFPAEQGDSTVKIFAPYCPYHEAGIFYSSTSQSETDLWIKALEVNPKLKDSDRAYSIHGTGIQSDAAKPIMLSPATSVPESEAKSVQNSKDGILNLSRDLASSIRTDKVLFQLSVPNPKYIYPLYYDVLEIVNGYKTSATGAVSVHFTGLRFFYPWDPSSHITLATPAGDVPDITPPVFGEFPSVPDIEVRYEGLNLTDRNDPHSDSRSCFASLNTLLESEYWLNYNDGKGSPTNPSHGRDQHGVVRLLIHSGADCHAPVITLGL